MADYIHTREFNLSHMLSQLDMNNIN